MTEKYIIAWPDGQDQIFQVGVNGVIEIEEPDTRNTKGSAFFIVIYQNGLRCRYMNVQYVVESEGVAPQKEEVK